MYLAVSEAPFMPDIMNMMNEFKPLQTFFSSDILCNSDLCVPLQW